MNQMHKQDSTTWVVSPRRETDPWRDTYCHVHIYITIAKSIYAFKCVFQILELHILLGLGPKDSINNSSLWLLASATSYPCRFAGNSPSHPSWVEKKKNPTTVLWD